MSDLIYERDYAREMLLVAIKGHTDVGVGDPDSRQRVGALIEQALNVGCDRNEIIIELARAGAQLFAGSAPDNSVALAHHIMDVVACRSSSTWWFADRRAGRSGLSGRWAGG